MSGGDALEIDETGAADAAREDDEEEEEEQRAAEEDEKAIETRITFAEYACLVLPPLQSPPRSPPISTKCHSPAISNPP